MLVRTSVTDQVYCIVRNHILTGVYGLGSYINIAQLSSQLEVSNTPIREALSKLESEGLVVKIGSKYQVIEISEKKNTDMDQLMTISMVGAFNLCVEKGKLDELYYSLAAAFQKQKEMHSRADYYDYMCATLDFDRVFISVADNSFLTSTLDSIMNIFLLMICNKHRGDQEANFEEHEVILDAVKAKDVDRVRLLLQDHYTKPLSKYPTKKSAY